MNIPNYFEVTVQEVFEDDNGKEKKNKVKILVESSVADDAMDKINKDYKDETFEWSITSVNASKIEKII